MVVLGPLGAPQHPGAKHIYRPRLNLSEQSLRHQSTGDGQFICNYQIIFPAQFPGFTGIFSWDWVYFQSYNDNLSEIFGWSVIVQS